MKTVLRWVVLCVLVVSCNQDNFGDLETESGLVTFSLTTTLSEDIGLVSPDNVKVTLTNTSTGDVFETTTQNSGTAVFDDIDVGNYQISASLSWTKNEFEAHLGYTPNTETISFNGVLENINISSTTTTNQLVLYTGTIGDLLIKQIYYTGSNLINGASFRDQFIEIYNNANETLYADQLIFAQVYGSVSTTVYGYTQNNGQYDWTQSVSNIVGENANTHYVYADYVYRIPGNGTDYPILPGKSIVIAATAVNHKSPLIDNEGIPLSVSNPDLTVDLSKADFEAYLGAYRVSIGQEVASYDIQNLEIPDLEVVYLKSGKDMILNTLGADAFVIFKHDEVETLNKYVRPGLTSESTNIYLQIPIDSIIDAVETNTSDPTNLYPRKTPLSLDGGYAYVPGGAFSSQSIIRKVEKQVNGRNVLLDTNNSTTDFTYLEQALPGAFAE